MTVGCRGHGWPCLLSGFPQVRAWKAVLSLFIRGWGQRRVSQFCWAPRQELTEVLTNVLFGNRELANAMLNTALFSPPWIIVFWLILWLKECGFLESWVLFTYLLSSHGSGTGLCTWHMQIIGLGWLNTSSRYPSFKDRLECMARYTRGGEQEVTNSSAPSLHWQAYYEDLKNEQRPVRQAFFWQMMKSLNAFYVHGVSEQTTLLESMEQK